MNTYREIIDKNTLPRLDDFKDEIKIHNLFGSAKFIEGIVKNPGVIFTDMSFNDFTEFIKSKNVSEIYGFISQFEPQDVFITDEILDNSIIQSFTSTLLAKYKDEEEDQFQFEYLISELQKSLIESTQLIFDEDIENEVEDEQIEDFITIDSGVTPNIFDDEDTRFLDEYKPNRTTKKLLDNIISFNNNIPKEVANLVKIIQLGCVIDGVTHVAIISNDIEFNPTIQLAFILSSYNEDYKLNIDKKIEYENKLLLEAEQLKQLKEDKLNEFLDTVVHDNSFVSLTNKELRLNFIRNLFDSKNTYYKLVEIAYPEVVKLYPDIPKSKLLDILNEITMNAYKKDIRLGKKIYTQNTSSTQNVEDVF